MGSSRSPLLALLAAAAACAGEEAAPPPMPTAVEPPAGYVDFDVPVTIRGDAFFLRVTQNVAGSSGNLLSSSFRAWLGDVELMGVTWVGPTALAATVPAGIAPGLYAVEVEGPYGTRGRLEAAYTAVPGPAPQLVVAAHADASTVVVGTDVVVRVRVTNLGPGDVCDVAVRLKRVVDGLATEPVSGNPPLFDLPEGQTVDVPPYTYPTTAPGTLTFEATAKGVDPGSGAVVPGSKTVLSVTVVPAT